MATKRVRPALSATRALAIIDFMSQAPSQAYTLSELVQHTGTNVASCHAILNVLVTRGYLARHPAHKTYRLAPALIGIGEAISSADALLTHAREAALRFATALNLETVITARAGSDIICLARESGSPHLRASMQIGQRVPLQPPLGASFLAWSQADEIEEWIARGNPADAHHRRAALALVRERGFLVTMKSLAQAALRQAVSDSAPRARKKTRNLDFNRALKALERSLHQPAAIEPRTSYDIDIIAAPIFDAAGQACYTLTLSGFAGPLQGTEILQYSGQLLQVCADVMRDSKVPRQRFRA